MFDSGNVIASIIRVRQSKEICILLTIRYRDICLSPLFSERTLLLSLLCPRSLIQNPFQVHSLENRLNFPFEAGKAIAG